MAFDPLPLNAAEDAVLVEQKPGTSSTVDDGGLSLTVDTDSGPLAIDDSTPIEVNVQQPVSVDDNGGSLTVDGEVAVTNLEQVLTDRQANHTLGDVDIVEALGNILIEMKLQTEMMRNAFDFDIKEEELER